MTDDFAILPHRPRTEPIDGGLRLCAPAKINLDLLVGPRGADGFHPIDSYVAKVTLYDRIDLLARRDGRLTLACEGADCGPEERNLAFRAARLLAERAPPAAGADIRLRKHIAPGTGLAGGSSDAAAVLLGLNELWGLGAARGDLAELAARLGSDVPLFLGPPAARMTGRGERLEAVRLPGFVAVLCLPGASCATGEVYAAFDEMLAAEGASAAEGEAADLASRQLPADVLAGGPPSTWRDRLANDLTGPAQRVCPRLAGCRRRLAEAVRRPLCLTGSGSASFILCDDDREAADVWGALPADLKPDCLAVEANPW